MTLTELRYVVAVARERHFGRAATFCNVSQPTLSQGIKKLEDELAIELFFRDHKEVSVTEAGKKIVDQAGRALREVNAIRELASALVNPLALPVRIGAIYTIGPYLFPHLIPILRQRTPDLQILVEENFTVNLLRRLHDGEIDVAILSLPLDEPGLETLPLYDEPFVALLPSNHALARQPSVKIADLEEETVLLLGAKHCFRDQVLEICPGCIKSPSANNSLQRMLAESSLETIRYMVAGGAGVSVLPVTAACAENYPRWLQAVRPFRDSKPRRRVALAWRQGFPRMEAIDAIVQAVNSCELKGVQKLESSRINKPSMEFS